MALKKPEWPEVGDLVVATVQEVTGYGAYVTLDEYNKTGLVHISEISSSWVRNIRNFLREKQKVILKVLRVDEEKRHVDLSLRRVTQRGRIEKQRLYKKERKAENLLKTVSQKLNKPLEEVYEKVGVLLEKDFGGLHAGLEAVAKQGANLLTKKGVPKNIAVALEEIAKEKIRISAVEIKGALELSCTKPDGVKLIQDSLQSAQKSVSTQAGKIDIYLVASPRYCVKVTAENYKKAEEILEKAVGVAVKKIEEAGGQGVFKREK
ncbi:MAG: translation initiation factor IF-2 subunit alpha [Thermoproteota archaeon]|nr:translation initiation factor IF-2 subunit alpha [Thermoproteota archaeon]